MPTFGMFPQQVEIGDLPEARGGLAVSLGVLRPSFGLRIGIE